MQQRGQAQQAQARVAAFGTAPTATADAAAHAKANGEHARDVRSCPLPRHVVSPSAPARERMSELAVLGDVHWFGSLSASMVAQLYRRGLRVVSPRYATILREGSQGSTMYVLLCGTVRVSSASGFSRTYEAGSCFGEEVLYLGGTAMHERKFTLTALTVCHGLRLAAADFEDVGMDLFEPKADAIARLLRTVPYFRGFKRGEQAKLTVRSTIHISVRLIWKTT